MSLGSGGGRQPSYFFVIDRLAVFLAPTFAFGDCLAAGLAEVRLGAALGERLADLVAVVFPAVFVAISMAP